MEKFSFLSFCPMAVTHPSTNKSQRCLTSVISWELLWQLGYTALRLWDRLLWIYSIIISPRISYRCVFSAHEVNVTNLDCLPYYSVSHSDRSQDALGHWALEVIM